MNSKKITLTIGTFLLLMFSMVTPVFANPDAPVCNKGVNSTDMIWLIPYFIYTVYQQFPIIQNLITIILLTILFLINLKPIDFKNGKYKKLNIIINLIIIIFLPLYVNLLLGFLCLIEKIIQQKNYKRSILTTIFVIVMTISGLVAYNTIILGIENYENIGCKGNKNLLICQENHTFYDDKKLVNDGRFTVIYKPNNKDKSLIFPIKLNSLSVARGINCEPYIENTWSNEYLEYGDANHILLNQCPNAYINVIEFYRSKYNELPQNTEEINKIMKKEYESIDIETNEILRECTTEGYDQFFEYKVDKITNDYTVYYKGTVIDRINDYPENVYLALNDKSTNKLKVLTAPTFSILLFSIMLIFFLFPYIPIGIIVIYIVIKTNKNKKNKG